MTNYSFQAFTLSEMTVAMVIASIAGTLGMFIYEKTTSSTLEWWGFQESAHNFENNIWLMQKEIDAAQSVKLSGTNLYLHKDSLNTNYQIGPHLVRNAQLDGGDTFLFQVSLKTYHAIPSTDLIDTLQLEVTFTENTLPLTLVKHYSFEQIILNLNADTIRRD